MVETDTDDEETGDYYVRCPSCDFLETDLPQRQAYSTQNNGCQQCEDNRSLAVSTMDNL